MTINLHIPSECRKEVIQSFKELIIAAGRPRLQALIVNSQNPHKRRYIMSYEVDQDALIEKCIYFAELKKVQKVSQFWNEVTSQFNDNYTTMHSWNYQTQKFRVPVDSALVQSLFMQFKKYTIFECVERLVAAVLNDSCVDWSKVDRVKFCERLKTNWLACITLMEGNSPKDKNIPVLLLRNVGISINEFLEIFLKPNPLPDASNNGHLRHIFEIIASHCDDEALFKFRQICRRTYNITESKYHLRHRIFFLNKCVKLQDVIGKVSFCGNNLLVTDQEVLEGHKPKVRVTPIDCPKLSTIFRTKTFKDKSCIAFKDNNGNHFILTAKVDSPMIYVKAYYMNQLSKSSKRPISERKDIILSADGEINVRNASLSVKDKMVTVNFILDKLEHHSVSFPLSAFDNQDVIEFKKE
jgi:hypothetical protein